MGVTKPQSPPTEPVVEKAPAVPGGPVAEMEAEGQAQSTSVPPDPDASGRQPSAEDVEQGTKAPDGARADQDIDTAGTEADDT